MNPARNLLRFLVRNSGVEMTLVTLPRSNTVVGSARSKTLVFSSSSSQSISTSLEFASGRAPPATGAAPAEPSVGFAPSGDGMPSGAPGDEGLGARDGLERAPGGGGGTLPRRAGGPNDFGAPVPPGNVAGGIFVGGNPGGFGMPRSVLCRANGVGMGL